MINKKNNFGISGSEIYIIGDILYKSSKNIDRFKKQIEKQVNFKESFYFKTPEILNYSIEGDSFRCEMKYIQGMDCITYFCLSDKSAIDNLCSNIIGIIENNLKNSKKEFIHKDIYYKKINSIDIDVNLKHQIIFYINNLNTDSFLLPIGEYHGDLTFTNMIFQTDNVYLVDFLDCFVDTPLQDIVKIRQETTFFWSILEHKSKNIVDFNYNKICLAYSYMDKIIDTHFKKYLWYNKYYNLMQIFNLARILPYNKEQIIEQKIYKTIQGLINEKLIDTSGR